MDIRYQVFISSTFADLKDERGAIFQTLMEMDCIPAGMELFPAMDEEQWHFIKRIIDDCDYYILVIGGRYGSMSKEGVSYTEMEYDYANTLKGDSAALFWSLTDAGSTALVELRTIKARVGEDKEDSTSVSADTEA
jgi:hypothetical protein